MSQGRLAKEGTIKMNWREMSDEAVQAHFNPRVASVDAEGSLARYASRSAVAREALSGKCEAQEDLRYGPSAKPRG